LVIRVFILLAASKFLSLTRLTAKPHLLLLILDQIHFMLLLLSNRIFKLNVLSIGICVASECVVFVVALDWRLLLHFDILLETI